MKISRVCVPVDVTELSLATIRQARAMAAALHAEVQLLAIASGDHVAAATAALEAIATSLDPLITWRVVVDESSDIERTLVGEVLADKESLWCLASHGRTAFGEMIFGSVSADVVRESGLPIVVVGPSADHRPEAGVVAVALDGSETSEAMLPAAQALASALGLGLRLLQVGHGHVTADASDQGYLINLTRGLTKPNQVDYDTLYGDTVDALTEYVNGHADVALLAMATHGVPAGARLSVPSTALKVLRHANAPLVLLHPLAADTYR